MGQAFHAVPSWFSARMSRDEQRVNADELKPLAHRAARHPHHPFDRQEIHLRP